MIRHAGLDRGHDQATLRGIAHYPPAAAVRGGSDGGRGALGRDLEKPAEIGIGRRIDAVSGAKLSPRVVARSAHGIMPLGGHHVADGHLVAGQRAGLVGADHGHRPERFHAREPPHEGVSPDHPLQSERQHERHHCRQSFRHGGHGEADRSQQQVGKAARLNEPTNAATANHLHDEDQAHDDEADRD